MGWGMGWGPVSRMGDILALIHGKFLFWQEFWWLLTSILPWPPPWDTLTQRHLGSESPASQQRGQLCFSPQSSNSKNTQRNHITSIKVLAGLVFRPAFCWSRWFSGGLTRGFLDVPLAPLLCSRSPLAASSPRSFTPLCVRTPARTASSFTEAQMLMNTVWLLQNYPGAKGEIHNFSLTYYFP